ncbi:acyl carrier protein [Anaplasma marginale]|nr:acyl carrier protein [Anaplasma marginale]AXW84525.1 acyl carrier protein [Anaplasma marginale]AXW85460.1 acyl carrier protein [Anaplasma marginale]KAA8473055.1 acyl carrier protein [Anaplasma marginale]KAA8473902.1 acyl carrier protein [Anaplasma marginale]KAB0451415.1 acyl carrier protein [Anaplasma marginale]
MEGGEVGNLKSDDAVLEDIKSKVMEAVIGCLKLKDEQKQVLSGTTNLAKDFNLDSLDFVDLIMSLEEKFSIEITDEEAQGLETVDDICKYIHGKSKSE